MRRETDPPPVDDDRAAIANDLMTVVARLNRLVVAMADFPLPTAQARLLAVVEQRGSARISDLARADQCSQPTMTVQVRRLEEQGLVTRDPDPADSRAVLISLTHAGEAVLQEVRRVRQEALRPTLARMNEAEMNALRGAVVTLQHVSDAMLDVPDPAS